MKQQEIELMCYPYHFNYEVIDGNTEIQIFGVTPNGQKITILEKKFKPYYYIRPKKSANIKLLLEKIKSLMIKEGDKKIYVYKVELTNNKEKPVKISARTPKELQAHG